MTGDLLLHGHQPLTHLGGRGVDLGQRLPAGQRQPHPGGRVVVEALRVADVLDAHRVAHPTHHALAAGYVGHAAGEPAAVVGLGHRAHARQQLFHGRRAAHGHAGRQRGAGRERVAAPQLDGVEPELGGQAVHLRLVGEAGLDGAEASHRPARRVVGVDHVGVDARVRHVVGAARERGRVGAHGRRAGRVRAAVEQDPGPHRHEPPLAGRVVLVAHPRGMAMDVAEERLFAPVHHLHRPAGVERQHAGMDLHRQVLASTEGAADAAENEPHPLRLEVERRGQLVSIDVEPLGGDVKVHPAVVGRHREAGLRAQERLVLHPHLVFAPDHHLALGVRVAVANRHVTQQVAGPVQLSGGGVERALGVGQRIQHLPVDLDLRRRRTRRLGVIGRDDRHRLALVADVLPGEYRLVGDLQAEGLAAGHVLMGEHGVDA